MLRPRAAKPSDSASTGQNFVRNLGFETARLLGLLGTVVGMASGLLFCSAIFAADNKSYRASELSLRDPSAARLAAPMQGIVDGLKRRDALVRLASGADVNLWVCRSVDPSVTIKTGPVGPTTFAAIQQIAKAANCEVQYVAGVVIIGPADWVDAVTIDLVQAANKTARQTPELADIRWPRLSTPTEALAATIFSNENKSKQSPPTNSDTTLPHDLWPAAEWKQIDRSVAEALVRHQFFSVELGKSVTETTNTNSDNRAPHPKAKMSERFRRRYESPDLASIRRAVMASDPAARIRPADGGLEVHALATAHRIATQAMLATAPAIDANGRAANQPDAAGATDEPRFSLKSTTSARNALTQLCQAANRTCVIQADAASTCERIITIEAVDQTLKELIDTIANMAGVTATWEAKQIVFRAK
ncbi:hypothetical protein [Rubripirellula reticaptiva]|uniref:Uncharacterized protein n=1 Tax=Rubripirellula reticaptiva TaxID=2528013 RepID=A0A5C6ERF1_9BACT|nr:hypothetical protein [Rubripirellula reticaptiva]TWU51612.1 hypothetical protein Poly59_32050 [Rubripirellula reticaptiva]